MLAISTMSATATAIFFTVAVALFLFGAIPFETRGMRLHFVALGLAAAFFPSLWNAWAATRPEGDQSRWRARRPA